MGINNVIKVYLRIYNCVCFVLPYFFFKVCHLEVSDLRFFVWFEKFGQGARPHGPKPALNDNEGLGLARVNENNTNDDDIMIDEDGKILVRQKATEEEARALIQRYEGQLTSGKTDQEYGEWQKSEHEEGKTFTPDP